jgi:hypothetical protein
MGAHSSTDDTLAAVESDAIPFRDGGDVPGPQPAVPLDHDGRGPRVDTRRIGDLGFVMMVRTAE